MLRDRAQHFRLRAEEARTIAEGMSDPCARIYLFNVAKEYEHLAALEARSAGTRQGSARFTADEYVCSAQSALPARSPVAPGS